MAFVSFPPDSSRNHRDRTTMILPARLLAAVLAPLSMVSADGALAADERLALNFVGADDTPVAREVPDTLGVGDSANGLLAANCFEADVFDLVSGERLGSAEDCLSEIAMGGGTASGSGVQVVGTTIFDLERGRLVIQGLTSVQPVNWPTLGERFRFTHVTGANSTANAVVDGEGIFANTGDFVGTQARVRLSGQVDLSMASEGRIAFDCIFVVELSGGEVRLSGQRYDATQGEIFWDRDGHATFAIYRDGEFLRRLDGNSFYESGLVEGVAYRYEVRAVTDGGEIEVGEIVLPGERGAGS